jgi:hypothetical protein
MALLSQILSIIHMPMRDAGQQPQVAMSFTDELKEVFDKGDVRCIVFIVFCIIVTLIPTLLCVGCYYIFRCQRQR